MTEHVKVYGVKPRIQYVADGILTTYEFPFATFKASDIEVYLKDIKQATNTYTVLNAGSSDGGSVVFNSAPESGTVITIVRNLSIERTSDFQEGSTLRAKVLNDELDYQIACQQQIADSLNRSMVLPPYAVDSGVNLTLPLPSAGKTIVWNADGTNLENSTVAVNELESTLKSYKESAESAATTATEKASIASDKADVATTKAEIATEKADEAHACVNQLDGLRTNCITHIPQDIKLELLNGTLTLKAGSSAYMPNGINIFTKCTNEVDLTYSASTWGAGYKCLVVGYVDENNHISRITMCRHDLQLSGETQPSVTTGGAQWYDTSVNKIKTYRNSAWVTDSINEPRTFPLALITVGTGNVITSIDDIFNGFGYMGSSLFVLPGVKGLAPNGRNTDGTLNNVSIESRNVLLKTFTENNSRNLLFNLQDNFIASFDNGYYDAKNNYLRGSDSTVGIGFVYAAGDLVSNKIENWKSKNVFHALNYYDAISFPAYNSGVNITSSVTSSNGYTAAKSCYVLVRCVKEASQNSTATLSINGVSYNIAFTSANNQWREQANFILPLSRGDTLSVNSTNATWTFTEFPMKG